MTKPSTILTRLMLGAALALAPLSMSLADDTQLKQLPSLEVKERLQSIEQINVTSETEPKQVKPVSQAVADILDEAEELDAQSD